MSNVQLLPIVECLRAKDWPVVLEGWEAAWKDIADECVVVMNPGHAALWMCRKIVESSLDDHVIPGFKVRDEPDSLYDPLIWLRRIEEAIFTLHYLGQRRVWWGPETILKEFWEMDAEVVPAYMRDLAQALLPLRPFGFTNIWPVGKHRDTYESHELPIRDAIRAGCGSVIFTEAQCGRLDWNLNEERATLVVRRARDTGRDQMPMLYLQSVGGVDVPQRDGQRMLRAGEAWQFAQWHGGTVFIYPGFDKFKLAGEELKAAMEAGDEL